VLKQLKGKNGAPGATGPQGPQGLTGAAGKDGTNSVNGKDGTNGINGESVTSAEFAGTKGSCTEGGSEFKTGAATAYACNGSPGSPWTAGGTLPSGKTEKGFWSNEHYSAKSGGEEKFSAPIKFPLPLASEVTLLSGHVKVIESGSTTECPGGESNPQAEAGFVCIFIAEKENAKYPLNLLGYAIFNPQKQFVGSVAPTGVDLRFVTVTEGEVRVYGTWAVTAEEA
jgi:hypothetical protein